MEPDVLVIGAGAIGLAVARELQTRGASVTVLDANEPGQQASWAAGGMLAPLGESPDPGPFLDFARASLELYPAFAAALTEESGVDPCFRATGKLVVGFDQRQAEALESRARWMLDGGHDVALLEGDEARRLEPALSPEVRSALHIPSDSHIDNRRLTQALLESVRRAGGRVEGHSRVVDVRHVGGEVSGVGLEDGTVVEAGAVVLAAGAWSARIAGISPALPVRPVRGQMVRVRMDAPPSMLVAGPGAYLIPMGCDRTGEVMVGASQEEGTFDATTDEATLAALQGAGARIAPEVERSPRIETWAGLRPGSADDMPIIGAVPGWEGLYAATGHFRNGILLTPLTARCVADEMQGTPHPLAAPFGAERFLVPGESRS